MVIDTSAVVAILLAEKNAERYERAIGEDAIRLISVASVLEAAIVLHTRYGEAGGRELDLSLHKANIETVAANVERLNWARHAYVTYGKGQHPARLNFGDCFSYALAKVSGEPLLFKGNDFSKTDVAAVGA